MWMEGGNEEAGCQGRVQDAGRTTLCVDRGGQVQDTRAQAARDRETWTGRACQHKVCLAPRAGKAGVVMSGPRKSLIPRATCFPVLPASSLKCHLLGTRESADRIPLFMTSVRVHLELEPSH